MKTYLEPQKEIPVFCEADVIVVGDSPAGIAAALAAGRNGAKTILIERFGCLGGLQTQCFQMIFSFIDPEIHGGILQEILTRLEDGKAMPKLKDMPAPTNQSLFPRLIITTKGKDRIPGRMDERAGTAAALAVKNNVSPKKINIRQLQDVSCSQGAFVSVRNLSDEILAPYKAIRDLSLLAGKPDL